MMCRRSYGFTVLFTFLTQTFLSAQTYAPWVRLSITTPDGHIIERTARDSGVASVTLDDGNVYEFRRRFMTSLSAE